MRERLHTKTYERARTKEKKTCSLWPGGEKLDTARREAGSIGWPRRGGGGRRGRECGGDDGRSGGHSRGLYRMLVLNLQTKELNLALVGTLFLLLELMLSSLSGLT